jgi:hypothetical protein
MLEGFGAAKVAAISLAGLAAALSALLGVFSPLNLVEAHQKAAMECNALRIEVRQMYRLIFPTLAQNEALIRLSEFSKTRMTVLSGHLHAIQRLHRTAHKQIIRGDAYVYRVDAAKNRKGSEPKPSS